MRRADAAIETGTVSALNHEGEGVVHAGKTVFVNRALPGERVRFQRRQQHRRHDEAELLEILAAAPQRVAPRCAQFGTCGGCALQHLDGAAQLAHKDRQLHDILARLGRVTPERWLEPLAGPQWEYRRRARLGARFVHRKGRSLVGFRERLSTYITDTEQCHVLAPPAGALLRPLGELLTALTIRERIPQIELAIADAVTVLVLRVLSEPDAADLEQLRAFERRHGVRFYLQPGGPASMRPLSEPAPALSYTLPESGVTLDFEPGDFVQVNAAMNRLLVQRALALLAAPGDARVLDLYCGLGNFTLPLARQAASVVGVEGDAGLIERARANARRNGIDNVRFHVADLAVTPDGGAPWLAGGATHLLLDPPRVGAQALLPAVAALQPRRLVYVSCHPATLARDLGLLVHEHGFKLVAAGVADMFPHTAHVESLAVLEPAGHHPRGRHSGGA
ncbi:MAG: 23S rRNA (uracil(1939)-C(5))-methyltransferase RlmD [Gammaproteobacteria bacterium]|nr:23S rRNA (uracil(1939)-C(5))-methyltransferase RlmD [Gammaproteobacteria bacterium]